MLAKAIFILILAAALWALLLPATIPRFFRRMGRSLGGFSRAGQELLTGEGVAGSPLSRYEALAGSTVEKRLLATHPFSPDPALQSRVGRIGSLLAGGAQRREIAYRFSVVEAEQPHAYALPGGGVLVSRPLVDLCGGDDHQLAGVLAHELAHIDLRHAVRHLAASSAARAGLRLLTLGRGGLLGRAVGAMEGLLENGYQEHEELEADRAAVELAARAGFDPRAYPYFLRTLLDRRLETSGYFRTHPPLPLRLRSLGMPL
jgi:predicted Zn-dependent protease